MDVKTGNDTSLSLTTDEKRLMGKNIREMREGLGISQDELGKVLKCSPQYVSDVERGKFSLSLKKLMILSKHYDVSCDRLIFGCSEDASSSDKNGRLTYLINNLDSRQALALGEFLRLTQE